MESLDYRNFLRQELHDRCRTNSRYSLRAFARDLDMEPAQLSRVMKGKQNISVQAARRVSLRIFKKKRKQEAFVSLVEMQLTKSPEALEEAWKSFKDSLTDPNEFNIDLQTMAAISDWYHIAILDLLTLKDGPKGADDIAKYLGISKYQAEAALERLMRLGLLVFENSVYTKTHQLLTTPHGTPSPAIRAFHKQMIGKALRAVDEQTVEERLLMGKTVALRKDQVEKLRKMTEDYIAEITSLVQASIDSADSLYQINVQIFDLKDKTKT